MDVLYLFHIANSHQHIREEAGADIRYKLKLYQQLLLSICIPLIYTRKRLIAEVVGERNTYNHFKTCRYMQDGASNIHTHTSNH